MARRQREHNHKECAPKPLTLHKPQGFEGLQAELRLDMRRLWRRNLGRDDRLISDHGRESRHPFLDEAFMDTILSLPLPLVADLDQPSEPPLPHAILHAIGVPARGLRHAR